MKISRHKLFVATLFIAVSGLIGCQIKPVPMIFSPAPQLNWPVIYPGQNVKVTVNDKRAHSHLLKVIRDADSPQLHQPGSPVIDQLYQIVRQSLGAQGLTLNDYAASQFVLDVVQLETVVEQKLFTYIATMTVEFKLKITKGNDTFYKTFSGHHNREGGLKYDIALLERDLNALVLNVLSEVYTDPALQQALNPHQ